MPEADIDHLYDYEPDYLSDILRSVKTIAMVGASGDKTKFIETQTSDSLLKLIEFDLLEEGMGILMDEWQPRREPCGPQG